MLLRDLAVRVVSFSSEPIRNPGGDRSEYFREYDRQRAEDPLRREQWRAAASRYRQRRRATK